MRREGPRGFTLLELLLILAMLALVSGLAMPSIGRGIDALQVRTEVARLVAFLRYGRQQAITKGRPHSVVIDPVNHQYALRASGEEAPLLSRAFHPSLKVSGDPLTVTFMPQGLSSGATVQVVGARGRAYMVTVDPVSGRVVSRAQ